jgi:hypothetical protein
MLAEWTNLVNHFIETKPALNDRGNVASDEEWDDTGTGPPSLSPGITVFSPCP